jgi:HEAT repeat protein
MRHLLVVLAVVGIAAPVWSQTPDIQGNGDFSAVLKKFPRIVHPLNGAEGDLPSVDVLAPVLGQPELLDLVCQLKDAEPAQRIAAAEQLGRLGVRAVPAIDALVEGLDDSYGRAAAVALSRIGRPAVPALLLSLKENNFLAALALEKMGPGVVPSILDALKSKKLEVNEAVLSVFDFFGPRAAAAVPFLSETLRQGELSVTFFPEERTFNRDGKVFTLPRPMELSAGDDRSRGRIMETLLALGPSGQRALVALFDPAEQCPHPDRFLDWMIVAAASLADAFIQCPGNEPLDYLLAPGVRLFDLFRGVRHIASADPRLRVLAAQALCRQPPGTEAVPWLRGALADADPEIRVAAAQLLGRMGNAALPAVPDLLGLLPDARAQERRNNPRAAVTTPAQAAIGALLRMGPAAQRRLVHEGVPVLIEQLQKAETPEASAPVCQALGMLGVRARAAVPVILERIRLDEGNGERAALAALLFQVAPEGAALLRPLLQDNDPELRRFALECLGRVPAQARAVLPELLELLANDGDEVRLAVLPLLGEIGNGSPRAVAALAFALRDTNLEIRQAALAALSSCSSIKEARAALLQCLEEEDLTLRIGAADLLITRDPDCRKALGVILDQLPGEQNGEAIAVLRKHGVRVKDVAPRVLALLNDPERADNRSDWAMLLAVIDPDQSSVAIAELLDQVRDLESGKINLNVLGVLVSMGPRARAAQGLLEELLDEPADVAVSRSVIQALQGFDPHSQHLMRALREALRGGRDAGYVLSVLAELGPISRPALPEVLPYLHSSNDAERVQALQVLARLEPTARTLPLLCELARDEAPEVRVAALQALLKLTGETAVILPRLVAELPRNQAVFGALEELGERAAPALPHLLALLDHPDEELSLRATAAIGGLKRHARPAIPRLLARLPYETNDCATVGAIRPTLLQIGLLWSEIDAIEAAQQAGNRQAVALLTRRIDQRLAARPARTPTIERIPAPPDIPLSVLEKLERGR